MRFLPFEIFESSRNDDGFSAKRALGNFFVFEYDSFRYEFVNIGSVLIVIEEINDGVCHNQTEIVERDEPFDRGVSDIIESFESVR